jgi:excisionase family DNA binding protein
MTPDEVAELLDVPRKTVLRWSAIGYMPGHKLGRRWRFIRNEIEQWLADDATRASRAD